MFPYRGFHRCLQDEGIYLQVFALAPVVARLRERLLPSRTFETVRLLQAADTISATFTVPFCTRPDSGEDDILGHRSTS